MASLTDERQQREDDEAERLRRIDEKHKRWREEEAERLRRMECERKALKLMALLHDAITKMGSAAVRLDNLFKKWPQGAKPPGLPAPEVIRYARDKLDALLKRCDG
jgi:hypothetical protein